ncbi:MAG TPA: tRNA (adenosine(37)-N6)-dimethylallyltransferase MiaA, partial [Candidatus Gracilibacteria bacterium]|nr:tRNA (adenosine(37)-N6)-dimethylallyltransferase MiaA [Candidatus Gracilibacteria bacterium]
IGTDKVPESKMEGVPHHLMNVVEPNQEFTLADFKRLAIKTINEIHTRQKLPILCGGTGLYINAVVDNYMIPQIPPQYDLRQQLAQYYEEHGAMALHNLLREKDPEAAQKINPQNVRYVIRALEINMTGGQKKTDQKGERMFHVFSAGIEWPREELYERINRRAQEQIDRGLLNEVKTLLMKGYSEKLASMSSLGYLELVDFIRGAMPLEEAVENIKKNTRNYCKRQLTWFRRYKDISWITPNELDEIISKKV